MPSLQKYNKHSEFELPLHSTYCYKRNMKPHLRAIDGQSLKQQFSGVKMKAVVNQKVGQVNKRNVLVLKGSQIQRPLKTSNSESAVSYCSPVESSFIEDQPDRSIRLKKPKYFT